MSVFIGQKSIFRRYCIQIVKDGSQIQVYNIINECVNHSSQYISVKVKKNLRKSEAQFREKLRKLRLRQNNDFLINKNVYIVVGANQLPSSAQAEHFGASMLLRGREIRNKNTFAEFV